MDPVIEALKAILELEEQLFGWSHNEEHYFEHAGYNKLAEWCDKKCVEDTRDRRREVLDRIFQLGGMIDGVETDPAEFLRQTRAKLEALHEACKAAYDPAEEADDYVTTRILAENQKCLEKLMEKIDAKLAKIEAIGEQLWLDRLI